MKKLVPFLLLIACAGMLYPQTVLKFCIDADSTGACNTESSQFLISKGGGAISLLLKNDSGLGATQIVYRIFKVDDDGKENFSSDIQQKIDANRNFVWQDAVFFEPGNYMIKVYDITNKETFICSGTVKILME